MKNLFRMGILLVLLVHSGFGQNATEIVRKANNLVMGKTSQGIKDSYGNVVIPKGTKFTQKILGEVDFTNIDKDRKSAYFGIYLNPKLNGEGKGLMRVIKRYAFDILGLKKLYAKVYKSNIKAIKLYKNENFKVIK